MIDKGLLFTFSGIDGCGKTTITEELERLFKADNIPCKRVEVMGTTELGRQIKQYVMSNDDLSPETQLHLYSAAIEDCISRVIEPLIEDGYIILCDRYITCTYVYQYKLADAKIIPRVSLLPNHEFILDLDPEIAAQRMVTRGDSKDRIDSMPLEFHNRVREEYIKYMENNKWNTSIVDASMSIEHITKVIKSKIDLFIRAHDNLISNTDIKRG